VSLSGAFEKVYGLKAVFLRGRSGIYHNLPAQGESSSFKGLLAWVVRERLQKFQSCGAHQDYVIKKVRKD
jgi:hypothetical protein